MSVAETFANQSQTTVSSGGTTAPSGGTTEAWTVASSASFPAASTGVTQFHVADTATGETSEIILVTNVSGTTWSVTRGAEGTTPVAHSAGFSIVQVVTAGFLGGVTVNPMTTSGDTTYGGTSGAVTRLAGNTTSTKNFYTQTGTGSASAAPAWDTIAAGDVPAATTSAQGAVILDGTASDIQPIGVQAAGSKGQAADAKHVHPQQSWQFMPEAYGAKGDGKIIGDATISGGSLSTLTSASASFTSADTGKYIMVNGAGTGGNNHPPLVTTITYVNSTTVTLASASSGAVTNASAIYGTDDTSAVNSAVSAASTWAQANSYYAQVILAARFYILATGPTQTGNGSSTPTFNAQIPLPYPAASGVSQKIIIELAGTSPADDNMYWDSAVPGIQGSCLVSMLTGPGSADPTYGRQSVVGGPSVPAGFTGGYANTKCHVDGVTVVIPFGGNTIAWDFRNLAAAGAGTLGAKAFASPAGNYSNLSQSNVTGGSGTIGAATSTGLWPPLTNNNNDCTFVSVAVEGFTQGLQLTEHNVLLRLSTIYCTACVQCSNSSGTTHANYIGYWTAEQTYSVLQNLGGTCTIFVSCLDAEMSDVAQYLIQDSSNGLVGVVNVNAQGGVAAGKILNAIYLKYTVTSTTNALVPGVWGSAPSVPASGTAQQNTSWRDATIYVNGTLTGNTQVDGTSLGVAAIVVRVPAGHTITLTYSSAPTWVWVLD